LENIYARVTLVLILKTVNDLYALFADFGSSQLMEWSENLGAGKIHYKWVGYGVHITRHDLEEVIVQKGVAHFNNQEAAEEISSHIYEFIRKF
jgi:hypothetical protein